MARSARLPGGVVLHLREDVGLWELHTHFAPDCVATFCVHCVDVARALALLRSWLVTLLGELDLDEGHPLRQALGRMTVHVDQLGSFMEAALRAVVGRPVCAVRTPGRAAMRICDVFHSGSGQRRARALQRKSFDLAARRRLSAILHESDRTLAACGRCIAAPQPYVAGVQAFNRARLGARRVMDAQQRQRLAAGRHCLWARVAALLTTRSVVFYLLGRTEQRLRAPGGAGRRRDLELYEEDLELPAALRA